MRKKGTHKNHITEALSSGFLVSAAPSSIPTTKKGIEHTPMPTKMTKRAAVLFDVTVMKYFRPPTLGKWVYNLLTGPNKR